MAVGLVSAGDDSLIDQFTLLLWVLPLLKFLIMGLILCQACLVIDIRAEVSRARTQITDSPRSIAGARLVPRPGSATLEDFDCIVSFP